ncbi:MAG: hypothetical protein K9K38_00275 [Rhodoferax sp.]|nr:hypothetical protein [Rhodoferax sp.]
MIELSAQLAATARVAARHPLIEAVSAKKFVFLPSQENKTPTQSEESASGKLHGIHQN